MEASDPERHHELQTLLGKMRREISGPMTGFEHLHKEPLRVAHYRRSTQGADGFVHSDWVAVTVLHTMRMAHCMWVPRNRRLFDTVSVTSSWAAAPR
ncbi:hypothetical protein LJR034_009013 [Caballeronia sp. LjRoot34]|uniref:hypothetical protein n=1 Tax=Caballeronia sp. LjRoot34 TaxID=3342325 RepID=UPI003ED1362B